VRLAVISILLLGTLTLTVSVGAEERSNISESWGIGTLGLQATEWRVTTHGTERGLMLAMRTASVAETPWSSGKGSQFLALGGGEGGFQAEYLNRFAYGFRFLRFGPSAFVMRGGFNFDIIGTPHGATYQLGPLLDLGFQHVSEVGFFDLSLQSVVTLLPAVFSNDSSKHPGEWFSTGPHLAAGFRSVYFEGNIARTERNGDLRTEFHIDLCGSSKITLCARLHSFHYDDAHKPTTMIGLMIGIGDSGHHAKSSRGPRTLPHPQGPSSRQPIQ